MPISRFGQIVQTLPVLSPADIAATATKTALVNLSGAHRCSFKLHFGSITATSADQAITVKVYGATSAATTTATAIAFKYRLSSAVATDTWGDVTAATAAAGASVATTDDGKVLLIDVDPRDVFAAGASGGGQYCYVLITPDAGAGVTMVGAIAEIEPRYAQNSMVSTS